MYRLIVDDRPQKEMACRKEAALEMKRTVLGGIAMRKLILLVLCLLVSVFALAGCSNPSEPYEEKTYTPDAQIREVHLDVRDREIEVTSSPDGQIHIQYSENSKEYYEITVSDENVLTMTSASDKAWTDYVGGKASAEDRKILLQIPDARLENLTLSTTNENVSLSALSVKGNLVVASNGGDIAFDRLNVGTLLSLTGKNGNIEGTVIGSYDDFAIQTEIKKGDSNLPDEKTDGTKTLYVSTNNGDVHIEFLKE